MQHIPQVLRVPQPVKVPSASGCFRGQHRSKEFKTDQIVPADNRLSNKLTRTFQMRISQFHFYFIQLNLDYSITVLTAAALIKKSSTYFLTFFEFTFAGTRDGELGFCETEGSAEQLCARK